MLSWGVGGGGGVYQWYPERVKLHLKRCRAQVTTDVAQSCVTNSTLSLTHRAVRFRRMARE